MATKKAGTGDEEMMRGLYEWCGDMGQTHGVGIRVTIAPTKRPGVFYVKAQALEMADGLPKAIRVQYKTEWPTSQHQTLAGALMNACMHLDHLLGMDGLEGNAPKTPVPL